jgi:hypothetical protein
MKVLVGIYETNVLGAVAWHCRCFNCGWESKRNDLREITVKLAHRHGKECVTMKAGLTARVTLQSVEVAE